MNRGDVWLINLGGRAGNRPVVVLTRHNVLDPDTMLKVSKKVVLALE
jgi:mRNA-degrading endonuclease toxin of MazEF toxin-antitoxin module